MIESIAFKNFKALRDAKLPLSQFTLIVGPNGSGKSTALTGLMALGRPNVWGYNDIRSVSVPNEPVMLEAKWKEKWEEDTNDFTATLRWDKAGNYGTNLRSDNPGRSGRPERPQKALGSSRFYSLDATRIALPVVLRPQVELDPGGAGLSGVLDRLRDQNPERFEALNDQLARWIPEFDRVLFETPDQGQRSIALRTRQGGHSIKAADLSHGTLIALALLTIAYLPEPPAIVCLEEPDQGLHPRLLRDVRDALYRLVYPEGAEEKRAPVQVIATTHNPYFLDLFSERPEVIVIAEKIGMDAKFSRLSDRSDLDEILGDAPLSEVWYSGVLGGVPAGT